MRGAGRWTVCGLACMALALAACSGLHSAAPVTQVYPLQPQFAAAERAPGGAVAGTLSVAQPVAAPALNSSNIALLRPDGAVDAFAASRWPGELPEELQPLIVQALRAGGRFASVQTEASPFTSDYLLQVEIQQFTAVYTGDVRATTPVVRVRLVAKLGRRADRSVLHSVTVDESGSAGANRMSAVIAAFNRATSAALQRMVADIAPP